MFLVITITIYVIWSNSLVLRTTSSCIVNPNELPKNVLDACFQKTFGNLNWLSNGIIFITNSPKLLGYPVINASLPESFLRSKEIGNKKCTISRQTIWSTDETRSTCPHYFIETTRNDRYPFTLVSAVCNCKRCLQSATSDHHSENLICKPKFINMPALIKRKSCEYIKDEPCNWDPVFERVAVSCQCCDLTIVN